MVKEKGKGQKVHSKDKTAAIRAKSKARAQNCKTYLLEPKPEPISKRLRKKT